MRWVVSTSCVVPSIADNSVTYLIFVMKNCFLLCAIGLLLRRRGHSYQLVFFIILALLGVASLFVCCMIHCKHLRLSDANKLSYLLPDLLQEDRLFTVIKINNRLAEPICSASNRQWIDGRTFTANNTIQLCYKTSTEPELVQGSYIPGKLLVLWPSWKTLGILLEFRSSWIYSWNFIMVLEKLMEYSMIPSHEWTPTDLAQILLLFYGTICDC